MNWACLIDGNYLIDLIKFTKIQARLNGSGLIERLIRILKLIHLYSFLIIMLVEVLSCKFSETT